MTESQLENLHNIMRNARHGRDIALETDTEFVDLFQHIMDLAEWILNDH